MAIHLPEKVKVACFDVALSPWTAHEGAVERRYGAFTALALKIEVDLTVHPTKVVDTLLHELGHAIWWAYGIEDEDKEERVVATLATAWTQVYRDNPELLGWIQKMLRGS